MNKLIKSQKSLSFKVRNLKRQGTKLPLKKKRIFLFIECFKGIAKNYVSSLAIEVVVDIFKSTYKLSEIEVDKLSSRLYLEAGHHNNKD